MRRWRRACCFTRWLFPSRSISDIGDAGPAWRRFRPRPGTSSAATPARSRSATPCSSASAPICRCWSTIISGWPPLAGIPIGILVSVGLAVVIGVPTFRLPATISAWRRSRSPSWSASSSAPGICSAPRSACRGRPAARLVGPHVPQRVPYYYLFLAVLAPAARSHLAIERAAWATTLRASRPANAPRAALACRSSRTSSTPTSQRRVHLAGRLALRDDGRLHRSGKRLRHPRSRCRW